MNVQFRNVMDYDNNQFVVFATTRVGDKLGTIIGGAECPLDDVLSNRDDTIRRLRVLAFTNLLHNMKE